MLSMHASLQGPKFCVPTSVPNTVLQPVPPLSSGGWVEQCSFYVVRRQPVCAMLAGLCSAMPGCARVQVRIARFDECGVSFSELS